MIFILFSRTTYLFICLVIIYVVSHPQDRGQTSNQPTTQSTTESINQADRQEGWGLVKEKRRKGRKKRKEESPDGESVVTRMWCDLLVCPVPRGLAGNLED